MFYNDAKKKAVEKLQKAEQSYNEFGRQANNLALNLYSLRKSASSAIDRVEAYVNTLANTPKEFIKEVAAVKVKISSFNEAKRIEAENSKNNFKGASTAATGTILGGALGALGPTAAMTIATTFGTASTGTAIATLSGAAATNASLAWLGGGALAAGGGGMTAGSAFLALAGPVGWGIAGTFIVGGGIFSAHKNKKAAEKATKLTGEVTKKIHILRPKVRELQRLNNDTKKLKASLDIALMVNTYPKDYLNFSNEQKEVLVALINNVSSMGKLINKRVS